MNNESLLNTIEDIYEISEIGIFPLSQITLILLFSIFLVLIIGYLIRQNYLNKNPWILELKIIKNELKSKNSISLDELSIYIKKIASLKYHHNLLNKLNFEEIINYLTINESNQNFQKFLAPLADHLYKKDNHIISGLEYNNILRVLLKWI